MTIEEFLWSKVKPPGDGWEQVHTLPGLDYTNHLWRREVKIAQHEGEEVPDVRSASKVD